MSIFYHAMLYTKAPSTVDDEPQGLGDIENGRVARSLRERMKIMTLSSQVWQRDSVSVVA